MKMRLEDTWTLPIRFTEGQTFRDFVAFFWTETDTFMNAAFLARFRAWLGKRFHWDDGGLFAEVFARDHEAAYEIENKTVRAELHLRETERGVDLLVYVADVSRWTRLYMAVIRPFRRYWLYPRWHAHLVGRWNATTPRRDPSRTTRRVAT